MHRTNENILFFIDCNFSSLSLFRSLAVALSLSSVRARPVCCRIFTCSSSRGLSSPLLLRRGRATCIWHARGELFHGNVPNEHIKLGTSLFHYLTLNNLCFFTLLAAGSVLHFVLGLTCPLVSARGAEPSPAAAPPMDLLKNHRSQHYLLRSYCYRNGCCTRS